MRGFALTAVATVAVLLIGCRGTARMVIGDETVSFRGATYRTNQTESDTKPRIVIRLGDSDPSGWLAFLSWLHDTTLEPAVFNSNGPSNLTITVISLRSEAFYHYIVLPSLGSLRMQLNTLPDSRGRTVDGDFRGEMVQVNEPAKSQPISGQFSAVRD